jgi:isopenicillin N synthase-like dioxygenase
MRYRQDGQPNQNQTSFTPLFYFLAIMLVRSSKLQFNLKRYSNSVSDLWKRDLVSLPVVDMSNKNSFETSKQVFDAFSTYGAFVAINNNVKSSLQNAALSAAESFFHLPVEEKEKMHVKNGGIAWRGWMPFGGEYTHGKLDQKEGLYLGPEHSESDPHMGTPLYGKNLFPSETVLPNFQHTALEYIQEIEKLGHHIMELTSLGLKLDADHIHKHYTYDSLSIVRMFYYPHNSSTTSTNTTTTTTTTTTTDTTNTNSASSWGIGEHSDYGLLTMLISHWQKKIDYHCDLALLGVIGRLMMSLGAVGVIGRYWAFLGVWMENDCFFPRVLLQTPNNAQ